MLVWCRYPTLTLSPSPPEHECAYTKASQPPARRQSEPTQRLAPTNTWPGREGALPASCSADPLYTHSHDWRDSRAACDTFSPHWQQFVFPGVPTIPLQLSLQSQPYITPLAQYTVTLLAILCFAFALRGSGCPNESDVAKSTTPVCAETTFGTGSLAPAAY